MPPIPRILSPQPGPSREAHYDEGAGPPVSRATTPQPGRPQPQPIAHDQRARQQLANLNAIHPPRRYRELNDPRTERISFASVACQLELQEQAVRTLDRINDSQEEVARILAQTADSINNGFRKNLEKVDEISKK